jgi:hypothetical protein
MSQGTTPTNYRDNVGTDNDYFLRCKKANEHTGSTGLDPKSILFSPLPRLRRPVLQSPFNSITQRTPKQQPPGQQRNNNQNNNYNNQIYNKVNNHNNNQVNNHNCNQIHNSRDISHKYNNNSCQSNNSSLYIYMVTTSLWEMYTSKLIKVKIRVR